MPAKVRPTKPQPYHHGDLRRSLIDAGMALVTENQDWTFSLREIARRAGVSHNAPYNHFADADALLIAIAAAGFLYISYSSACTVARGVNARSTNSIATASWRMSPFATRFESAMSSGPYQESIFN